MATPITTEIVISRVGDIQHSGNGHPFVECQAQGGTVAFWGGPSKMRNIEAIRRTAVPFTIVCDSIPSNWPNHGLWIPEGSEIYLLASHVRPERQQQAPPEVKPRQVTLLELAEWRRNVIEILKALEAARPDAEAQDGVAGRISRLSHEGVLPREIGALMRAVTEMRNAAEYNGKTLSTYESLAILNAWMAVEQWWKQSRPA